MCLIRDHDKDQQRYALAGAALVVLLMTEAHDTARRPSVA